MIAKRLSIAPVLVIAASNPVAAQEVPAAATFMTPIMSSAAAVLRLHNPTTSPATVTARVRAGNSSTVINTVVLTVAPMATVQSTAPTLTGQTGTSFGVALTSTAHIYVQHLLGNAIDGSWRNLSSCGGGLVAPTRTLINVSTGAPPAMAGLIVLHVTGANPASATVTIADSATGQIRGTWRSPIIPAGGMSRAVAATDILAEAGIGDTAALPYVNLKVDDAFPGHAQHLARSANDLTTDLSAACSVAGGSV